MKKIMFYSQHLAGIGHLVRSTEIVRSLAQQFEVYFVHGGQAVPGFQLPNRVNEIRLPGLYMEGPVLKVVDDCQPLEKVQEQRQALLLAAFDSIQPDCLITEGFPFSKHTLRFELIPLLKHIEASGYPTKVVCCLRDIIMTQAMTDNVRAKKQTRTCKWINRYYDLVLYHSDAQLQRLEENFASLNQLNPEVFYTGYVTQSETKALPLNGEDLYYLNQPEPSIVVSVGGGRHGYGLLSAIASIAPTLAQIIPHKIYAFTGPYLPEADLLTLQEMAANSPNLVLRRFTPRLMDYLKQADLSISLGGYNTTMNVLKTGVRSLIYPSPSEDQSGEQSLRARKLEKLGILTVITEADLAPMRLIEHILNAFGAHYQAHRFKLDGAQQAAMKLQQLLSEMPDSNAVVKGAEAMAPCSNKKVFHAESFLEKELPAIDALLR
ncbi:MAG: glycosyl transferase [Leptolyngbyaceae cyanobacterium SM1_1_3]|nr:glycosyl transferase [Leptolyngbyaceae cyanobacterium SM1_1_3]NJO11223.1 glycosyl transferase [Leptolyngbyaceae cyanobacterium SL_1_1]